MLPIFIVLIVIALALCLLVVNNLFLARSTQITAQIINTEKPECGDAVAECYLSCLKKLTINSAKECIAKKCREEQIKYCSIQDALNSRFMNTKMCERSCSPECKYDCLDNKNELTCLRNCVV